MSGVVSTISCFPLDVIRTRLACDSSYKGMADVVRKVVKAEGVGALYKVGGTRAWGSVGACKGRCGCGVL